MWDRLVSCIFHAATGDNETAVFYVVKCIVKTISASTNTVEAELLVLPLHSWWHLYYLNILALVP